MSFKNKVIQWAAALTTPLFAVVAVWFLASSKKEEGMFPLSYMDVPALQKAGLKLNANEIFNPGNIALTNALVRVGGCTGSFISEQGLIITNHHCVYGEVSRVSTQENNYLENGYVASRKEVEIPVNMECRITLDYKDVSAQVLMGVGSNLSPEEKSKKIAKNIEGIIKATSAENPEYLIDISEMFVGKSYTLFKYATLKDVRLVYVPPVSIGQFGGDLDNWEWPRHNGDFSIVRAYVGKDGKPAKYSPDNVPYKPAKHLKIKTTGTKEGDFVFILGYPGATFRHETAGYMKFQEEFQLPVISNWYAWKIAKMHESSRRDTLRFLKYAGTIQGLANVEKNYRGKIQGLKRTGLVKQKYDDEAAMVAANGGNGGELNKIVGDIYSYWNYKQDMASELFHLRWLTESRIGYLSYLLAELKSNIAKAPKDTSIKIDEIKKRFSAEITKNYQFIDPIYEMDVAVELMNRLSANNKFYKKKFGPFRNSKKWKEWLKKSIYFQPEKLKSELLFMDVFLSKHKDPLDAIGEVIYQKLPVMESNWNYWDIKIKALMPLYLSYKEKFKSNQFIPDANKTLRLTYGYIKGYNPNGDQFYYPYTNLDEMFAKANTKPDYRLPEQFADNLRVANPLPVFKDPATGKVVVGILYNLDTTGGNSGSPILDAEGNLIGVNFDRSFTATINDYAWNESYSRSIGVDIRYVLYVMKYVGESNHLFEEMGIKL